MVAVCKPRRVSLLSLALCGVMASGAAAAVWNLSGSVGTHDPGIAKQGNTWWIAETSDSKGIKVKWSHDGHAWFQSRPVFPQGLSWWHPYNGKTAMTWAGEFSTFKGKSLLFYSISTLGSKKSAIGLATASSIARGDWVDKGIVIASDNDSPYNAIDPNFVVDAAGNPWLAFGSWNNGIYITRVDASTLKPIGFPVNLAKIEGGIEAPTIVRNGNYYYLFVSKGTCCDGAKSTYHIDYGRSPDITGPYLDKNGVDMMKGGGTTLDAGSQRWKFPGGQSIVKDNNRWVMARHEKDASNNYNPVLFINDLYWKDGWPGF